MVDERGAGAVPRRQRVAAYAVIRRPGPAGADGVGADELLLTRLSPHIAFKGWTLPGGGVDHGEHPREALRREIYEEAGLHAEPGRILDVYSHHYTGPRPDGVVEDYHAIGLLFEATVLPESREVEPFVVDVGGSTDLARWFSVAEARALSRSGALSGSATLALALVDPPAEPASMEAR